MLKLPIYNASNYQTTVKKHYDSADKSSWVEIEKFLEIMSDELIAMLADANTMKLGEYLKSNSSKIASLTSDAIGGGESVFYAIKMLFPTLWACDYFLWNVGKGKHHGIDIIMPQGTPIPAFVGGEITKVKKWDGVKKDDGNCVVIKGDDGLFYCYEHLDSIDVTLGAKISAGEKLGTCGSTGNSTQFHLHLQVDQASAPFHPYWSANAADVLNFTKDPLKVLRTALGVKTVSSGGGNLTPTIKPTIAPTGPNPTTKPVDGNDDFISDISKALGV